MRILLLVLLMAGQAWGAEGPVWYCVEQAKSGLAFENGKWEQGPFNLNRFTLKYDADAATLERGIDGKKEVYRCSAPYVAFPEQQQCAERLYFITLNTELMRGHLVMMFGWIGGDDSLIGDPDTAVNISAFTCEKF